MPTSAPSQDCITDTARAILHPEEARLRQEVLDTQIVLGKLAMEHREELQGSGHYEELSALLQKAESLLELAETLDSTPVQIVPAPKKLWEAPEKESGFFASLSEKSSKFLRTAGEWLKTQGERLEASRCRASARQYLAEAGAILGCHFTAEAAVPMWGVEAIVNNRAALAALAAYQTKLGEQTVGQQIDERVRGFASQIGSHTTRDNFRSVIDQTGSQFRTSLIEFIAWGVRTCGSYSLFIGLLAVAVVFVPTYGAILMASVLYVWTRYRTEVDAKIAAAAAVDAPQPTSSE